MNARAVLLQVVLAVLALVAAVLVWQRGSAGLPGEVTVLEFSSRALQRVRFDDEARVVELFRDERNAETLWVRLGEKPGELRGNEMAKSLFTGLAPLKAIRALGVQDEKKLEEMGLTGSPRKLTLTVAGQQQVLTLGARQGEELPNPYARREDGSVFLLGPSLVPQLESAAALLVDRRMHTFELGEFDAFVVFQGANVRSFVVKGAPPEPVTVAPQQTPEAPDELARAWLDRVWRLPPRDMLGRGEEPPGGEPEEVFRVEFKRGGRVLGQLTVARGGEGDFFARTEHTAGWVRLLSGVDALAAMAVTVAAGN
ncbi:hypothetical protein ATI61_111313 [Archangium gephyra]|uniref:DUF4340 domain-containing protein n=1 Tax=Archangium gephyra TaxID=48 RepID=A0AAC8QH48_9BACT|nr:hypothetical protein [Archangium gephyra]AKJ07361.1 Hypothetical protein AA314_08987 [Archangium gephyra]REG26762.1 hypothetical protein ATI61_111313 [Archangium gephyra]